LAAVPRCAGGRYIQSVCLGHVSRLSTTSGGPSAIRAAVPVNRPRQNSSSWPARGDDRAGHDVRLPGRPGPGRSAALAAGYPRPSRVLSRLGRDDFPRADLYT